ncbi:MAG: 50S ribosomal protein L31 [Candidatus Kerfeldbacteria bacterium]|nr:50S ribosomal protein L31 [Candidatus Kerfeldbacteria bacterium]
MKKEIHPPYYQTATITCACGNSFSSGSTLEVIQIEVCSNCHPFFTGKQKFVDTARRVEKFQERTKKVASIKAARPATSKKSKRRDKDTKKLAKAALKSALKEA